MVYCGEASRTYSSRNDVGNVTTIKVEGLLEGITYFCAVTAYDGAKLESTYSNEVSATIAAAAPVVAFSASPTSGKAPLDVSFTNATTGQVTTWSWSFGDGGYSTAQSPTHTYSTPGQYAVTLTAIGPEGSSAATLDTLIQVSDPNTKGKGNGKGNGTGKGNGGGPKK